MVLKGVEFEPAAYARWFETELGQQVWADERRAIHRVLGPVAGQRVLDVGCGDGRLSLDLTQAGARVVGVDRSPSMLRAAHDRATAAAKRQHWACTDAGALPFPDCSFDIAIAVTLLCFARDPVAIVRDMARVTRPGGRVILGELGRWNAWALQRRVRAWRRGGVWGQAHFWGRRALERLVRGAALRADVTAAAVFYPQSRMLARIGRHIDPWLGERIALGAAFLVVSGSKPGSCGLIAGFQFDAAPRA